MTADDFGNSQSIINFISWDELTAKELIVRTTGVLRPETVIGSLRRTNMTIELSNDEVNLLMMELGYVAAAHAQREGFIPTYLKTLTDKILVQTGGKPYWMKAPKSEVVKPGDLK